MHPDYGNANAVGPTGPDDPWLSFLSVQTIGGQPLALLANFSMHYFSGHNGLSADFAGAFSESLAKRLAKGESSFVGIMSQGTSGDLWWGDYNLPKAQSWSMHEYVDRLIELVTQRLAAGAFDRGAAWLCRVSHRAVPAHTGCQAAELGHRL